MLKLLGSLGDKMVPRIYGGQVGQSGDLLLAKLLSDKRRFTLIVKEITELESGG